MKPKRWLSMLPALLLGVSSLLVARPADRDDDAKPPSLGSTADLSTAPRVGVDRPKPTYMLHERDKRVHGLKPFQDLVDAAPAGSTPITRVLGQRSFNQVRQPDSRPPPPTGTSSTSGAVPS